MNNEAQTEKAAGKVPRATYRLQFHEGFRLRDAFPLVPYLAELGVSHLYASPLLLARPHSRHGYDTCDFSRLNPELGEEAELEKLVILLRTNGMGLVLDMVANHMGIGGRENRWWWDVLVRGPDSPYAGYFDIDWGSADAWERGKVVAPILGDRYQNVLARGELQIEDHDGECRLRYFDKFLPLAPATAAQAAANLAQINEAPAALDRLLANQHYRLVWFRHGDGELNYRRFFNYSHLPGICVERAEVFQGVMERIGDWVRRGWVDGLRIDHIDGLRDPQGFLEQVKALAPETWIVVEKILEEGESLPAGWPVAGTTGYDFANAAAGLFVDPNSGKAMAELYGRLTSHTLEYTVVARDKKRLALRTLLAAETGRLVRLLVRICAGSWRFRDFSESELREGLIELAACLPVYRTYIRPATGQVAETDYFFSATAIRTARRNRPDLGPDLFECLTQLLLLRQRGELEDEFVARFQQLTGPAMAKGVEDTACYCYNRFAGLNEVGGNPARFGVDAAEFHRFCTRQQKHHPGGMLASSTHDTKRSEDVRARLNLLSEIPEAWSEAVARWSALNERHRREGMPDRNLEYLYYQTLVGAWPLSVARALSYMQKAAQEAKEHTWAGTPNSEYESALRLFIIETLADAGFTRDVEEFVEPLLQPGCVNSLAQTLLKLTAPGVPDIYQGTELWDLSLVDPDNRRPVDFSLRQRLLASLTSLSAEAAWKQWPSGLPKLWLIQRVLKLRQRRPECFGAGAAYEPLQAAGYARAHVFAFMRCGTLITVVPRLVIGLGDDWRDTAIDLPPGKWRVEFTGAALSQGRTRVGDLLRTFPVAVLIREEE